MDIRAFLTFVAAHVEQIFGTTLALTFVTGLILLIRSVGSKGTHGTDAEAGASGSVVQIDAQSIEDAVKRALASGAVATPPMAAVDVSALAATAASGGTVDPAVVAQMTQALQDRDQKIEQVTKELEKVQQQIQTAQSAPSAGGDGASADTAALQAKLEELQTRLAEYEIIEDDIADLSMFKEENIKLKAEVEDLRVQLTSVPKSASAPVQPEAAPSVPASAPLAASAPPQASPQSVVDELMDSIAAAPAPAPPVQVTKSEGFELDYNDEVMKEFAAAMEDQRAPPAAAESQLPPEAAEAPAADVLAGETDADKMLSEVAALESTIASEKEETSALEDSLDTDKLLAEVGTLEAEAGASSETDESSASSGLNEAKA